MKYKDGDIIIAPVGKHLRRGKILGVQPNLGTYLVSFDHGAGGLHYIHEEDIRTEDQVAPKDIYREPGKVEVWY